MDKEELAKVVRFFTEIQKCPDKRTAFLKGALFGLGFVDLREPNWEIIKKMIKEGQDRIGWLCIEKDNFDIHRKLKHDQIELIESMLADSVPEKERNAVRLVIMVLEVEDGSKALLPIGDNAKRIKEGLGNLLAVKIRKYDMFFIPLDARIII